MLDSPGFRNKIASLLKINESRVCEESLLAELVNDSFALVDMVVELQEDLGVRLTQDNLKEVRTVSDLFAQFQIESAKQKS